MSALVERGGPAATPGAVAAGDASPADGTRIDRNFAQPRSATLRADFGAHLEADYPRLVAQLYAITLDAREAHGAVQDAYSRAWRHWADVGGGPDLSAWARRVAVRSTIRSWRRLRERVRPARPADDDGAADDPRSAALLAALARLTPAERRVAVLFHMAGCEIAEIAAIEQVSTTAVETRLTRSRHTLTEGLAEALPAVLNVGADDDRDLDDTAEDHDADDGYDDRDDGYEHDDDDRGCGPEHDGRSDDRGEAADQEYDDSAYTGDGDRAADPQPGRAGHGGRR